MNRIVTNPFTLLGFSIVAVVVLLNWPNLINNDVMIDYELGSEDYTSILTTLFFVSLIAERFVEILIGASRRPGRKELERKLANSSTERQQVQGELDDYRAETEKQAMRISYAIGIFIALAGFRVFSALIDNQAANDVLFNTMDIILTGGIIAGGSKGINGITSAMGKYLEKLKVEMK